MIRKRISYVEDSFEAPTQESMVTVKPFFITRKKVSRVVRKTIRNKAKNWIEDYISQKEDKELFNEILSNRMQKPLSLHLKKTYPLSLCEIRVLEIKRPLEPKEVPKKIEKEIETIDSESKLEEGLDQLKEIEDEKIKQAQEEIKKTQAAAGKLEEQSKEKLKPQETAGFLGKEKAKEKKEIKTEEKEAKKTLKTKKTKEEKEKEK